MNELEKGVIHKIDNVFNRVSTAPRPVKSNGDCFTQVTSENVIYV